MSYPMNRVLEIARQGIKKYAESLKKLASTQDDATTATAEVM